MVDRQAATLYTNIDIAGKKPWTAISNLKSQTAKTAINAYGIAR